MPNYQLHRPGDNDLLDELLDADGNITISGDTTETKFIEVGAGRTGDGVSHIDLVGDNVYGDYGTRLLRNAGENGYTELVHRGTNPLYLSAADASSVRIRTNGGDRLIVDSSGNATINGNITSAGNAPQLILSENDTTTYARLTVSGGDLYLQAGASGLGASGSGDIRITGYNNTDIGAFTVRAGGANQTVWHSGNDGTGSGLDADLLDGLDSTDFLRATSDDFTTGRLAVGAEQYNGKITGVDELTDGVDSANFAAYAPGTANSQRVGYNFWPTFGGAVGDLSPRRAADILAGFDGGAWGNEYLSLNVGRGGTANDANLVTDEVMRLTNGVVDVTGNVTATGDVTATGNVAATGNVTATGTVTAPNYITNAVDDRVKYNVWNLDNSYGVGMGSGYTFGHIPNEYAMTFQMDGSNNRGWWWGMKVDASSAGAMSLTGTGKLHVDDSITVGPNKLPVGPTLPKSRNFTVGGNLLVTDVGQHVNITAAATPVIPNSTFAEGDIITLVNTSGADRTITCSITTAYVAGADVATCTLASFGLCTILFTSATQCFIAGDVS